MRDRSGKVISSPFISFIASLISRYLSLSLSIGWPTRTQLGLKDYRATINRILDRISLHYRAEYGSISRPISSLTGLRNSSRSKLLAEEEAEEQLEEGISLSDKVGGSRPTSRARGNSSAGAGESEPLLPKSSLKKGGKNYGGINE